MIVVKLMGGLGNQMFQYATGKALAERLGVPLKLDTTFLELKGDNLGYTLRNFELDVFKIEATIASKWEIFRWKSNRLSGIFPRLFSKSEFSETQKNYMKEFGKLKDPVYLDGYWQTEKYFLSIEKQLRENDFMPVAKISDENAELLNQIENTNAVSLHVRRGDYVTNAHTHKFHGTCSIDYYERAAKLIAEKTGAEHFFVFSDEPAWVKENIVLPFHTTCVSHNKGHESHWDMFLMRHCKHNIIANSSFSWWGAWLNSNAGKMVIAPKNWFNESSSSENEIIPEDWIRN